MNYRRLLFKSAFVIIATAFPLIGFSAETIEHQAVEIQVSTVAQPINAAPTAMIQEEPDRVKQINCLARNIYFEARGEPAAGQMAVGLVTINRTKSRGYPKTICGVVHQKHQFSWLWDKKADHVRQHTIYARIEAIAEKLYDQYYKESILPDLVYGATHFHNMTVNPAWRGKRLTAKIGRHKFYRVGGH